MKYHAPTQAYVARRTAEGKTKLEIIAASFAVPAS